MLYHGRLVKVGVNIALFSPLEFGGPRFSTLGEVSRMQHFPASARINTFG